MRTKKIRKQLEVDFVINRGNQRYYIQSALTIDDPYKRRQETESLIRIPDFFKKIVVVKDNIEPWRDDIKRQHLRRGSRWKGAYSLIGYLATPDVVRKVTTVQMKKLLAGYKRASKQ